MSTTTLTNLRDYLYGTLTPANMTWLAAQLNERAKLEETPVKRYTMDEINAILDEAEANFEAGRYIDDDDIWDELDEELAMEEKVPEAI